MNDDFLRGKKILFIGPVFYNYHNEIVSELQNMGADVDFYAERAYSLFYEVSKKAFDVLHKKNITKHLENILSKVSENCDFVFIIRGEILTTEFISQLKKRNPSGKFIMYQWDTSINNINFPKLIPLFDKVLTFDRQDAVNYSLEYLPLFYVDTYKNLILEPEKKHDIVFFGGFHSDRLNVVKQIDLEAKRLGLKFKHHLYISFIPFFKRLLMNKIKLTDLKYIKLYLVSNDEILNIYKNSKTVLDIEHSGQNGFTIRTFETLGSGLKLITTNSNILKEDFFDSSQIYFLDRNNIKLEKDFFISKNKKINNIDFYSINNWIKNVFY